MAPEEARAPWVTWIVVCHESARDLGLFLPSLRHALDALAAEGCTSELIVVDNASRDGSAELVARHAPDAKLLRLEQNVGYGAAINRASRLARGRWLAFGNADLFIPPGGLSELPRLLSSAPDDVALLGPALFGPDGRPSLSAGRFPSLMALMRGLRRPAHRRKYLRRRQHRRGEVDWLTGACLFARADVFDATQGFDEGFFLYYEDVDLARRLSARGHRVVFEPKLNVIHVRPHHGRPAQPHIEQFVRDSRLRYFRKHRSRVEAGLLSFLMSLEPVFRTRSRPTDAFPAPVEDARPDADAERLPPAVDLGRRVG